MVDCDLPPAEDIVGSLAHAAPSLSVPRPPGPGEHNDDDYDDDGEEQDHDGDEDDDGLPEQLVVDDDGVDEVESKEPEEEARDPASQLRIILMFGKNIFLPIRLTCNSSREVAV